MLLDETKQWDRHETEISIFCQQADRESAGDRAANHAFYAGDDFHRSLPKYEGRDPWPLSEYEECGDGEDSSGGEDHRDRDR